MKNSILLRYLLLFSCGWVTVILINYFFVAIALFTTAGIFAALLNYPVAWLSKYIPRGWAIALTFIVSLTVLLGLVTIIGLGVVSQGQALIPQLKDIVKQQGLVPFQTILDQLNINKVIDTLQAGLLSGLGIVQTSLSSLFISVFGAVISLYMLIDGEKLWQAFLKLLPEKNRERFAITFRQSFLGFIRGQLLLMMFLSISTFIVLPFLGVKYALVLAVILGVIDAIPGIGATLGIGLVSFIVFASQGTEIAVKVFIACIVLAQIQDNYVRPKVMGDALELNPVLLFLSLFIGERIAGLLGVFLAIPIAGMIAVWLKLAKQDNQREGDELNSLS